jgi:hypothetical protein
MGSRLQASAVYLFSIMWLVLTVTLLRGRCLAAQVNVQELRQAHEEEAEQAQGQLTAAYERIRALEGDAAAAYAAAADFRGAAVA